MRQEEGSEGFGSHIKNLGMKTIAERSAVQVNIDTITWYQWINIWFCFSSSLSRVVFFFRCIFILDPWFAGSSNVGTNKWR